MDYSNISSLMWLQACELLDRAERMRRHFYQPSLAFRRERPIGAPIWEPPVDIMEAEDTITIILALPGVPSGAVSVNLEGRSLVVEAERAPVLPGAQGVFRRLEIPYGRFYRRIDLSATMGDVESMQLENGLLRVILNRVL